MCQINFEVIPKDTLLFRDTMSMEKGTTNFIESMAMPYPSVIYGMLTTALMREGFLAELKAMLVQQARDRRQNQEKKQHLHEQLQKSSLQLNHFFLTYDGELFIPAPLDLFTDHENRTYQGKYKDGLLYAPECSGKKLERADGRFIRFSEFLHQYREGQISGISLRKEAYFWGDYSKAGIEIEKTTGAAKRNMLYYARMREAREKTGYFAQAVLQETGVIFNDWTADVLLGGRNRTAYLKQLPENDYRIWQVENYKKEVNESDLLKLIFTTPYIMADKNVIDQRFNANEICVRARVTGKPLVLGGFDMAGGKRKKLQTALPAGSVYLIQSDMFKGKTFGEIEKKLTTLLDIEDNQYFRGFGRFVLAEEEIGL